MEIVSSSLAKIDSMSLSCLLSLPPIVALVVDLASEDDTISISTQPGEMSSEPASETDIKERRDKMPASYRKDDELRRRK